MSPSFKLLSGMIAGLTIFMSGWRSSLASETPDSKLHQEDDQQAASEVEGSCLLQLRVSSSVGTEQESQRAVAKEDAQKAFTNVNHSALEVPTRRKESIYMPGSDGTFAQNYQDTWFVQVALFNGWDTKKEPSFFLDLGAYKGFECSNTALLEKKFPTWDGICVEGHVRNNADFHGRRCLVVNHPLSNEPKEIQWFGSVKNSGEHNNGQLQHIGHQAIDSTVDRGITLMTVTIEDVLAEAEKRARLSAKGGVLKGDQQQAGVNFSDPSNFYISDGRRRWVPLASIDVEGEEGNVLWTWPWKILDVGVFIIEGHSPELEHILNFHGYKQRAVRNPGVDTYWMRDEHWHPSFESKEFRIHPDGSHGC